MMLCFWGFTSFHMCAAWRADMGLKTICRCATGLGAWVEGVIRAIMNSGVAGIGERCRSPPRTGPAWDAGQGSTLWRYKRAPVFQKGIGVPALPVARPPVGCSWH